MSAYRNYQGAWVVSDIVGGYLETRTYFGYTERQALAEFRREFQN
jgi:hypothetical protein